MAVVSCLVIRVFGLFKKNTKDVVCTDSGYREEQIVFDLFFLDDHVPIIGDLEE